MSDDDRKVIGEALRALADGPFIPGDQELEIVTDATRNELAALADRWPTVEDDLSTWTLVTSVLAQLWGYPHGRADVWTDHLSVTQDELLALSKRIDVVSDRDGQLQRLIGDRRDAMYVNMSDERVCGFLSTIEQPGINPRFRRRIIGEAQRRGLQSS